jgi:hypothetical protein
MENLSPKALERRAKSIEILKEQGVPYIEHLPVLETEDDVVVRSAQEIAKRAVTCLLAVQVACSVCQGDDVEESREFFTNMAQHFGVTDEFTEKEKEFLFGTQIPNERDAVNMSWKYEAYWGLLWALGIVEKFDFPADACDCGFAIKAVSERENFDDFMKGVKLRSMSEILDELDLLYRYHWACVNARINGRETPAGLSESVVSERRWGLEWLTRKDTDEDDWDYIALDT